MQAICQGKKNQDQIGRKRERLMALLLFLALFMTFSYFIHVIPGWNVHTRIALTYAIVEQGTFAIDDYHDKDYLETNDKAFYNGHFYCDKSPALSFLAVPFYRILWFAKMSLGYMSEMRQPMWVLITIYLLTVMTVSLSASLAGVLLWKMAQRFGASSGLAAAIVIALLCGTLLFGYSTLFFPYLPAILCFMSSYLLILDGRLRSIEDSDYPLYLTSGLRLFWAGLLMGMGWFFDYTAGLVGVGLSVYLLWAIRRRPWGIWKFILGGLIPVATFYAYTYSIFGEFSIPYKYEYSEYFRTQMSRGFQGIHFPKLAVLYYITIHPFKGVFFWSPVLLLWFAAIWQTMVEFRFRRFQPDVVLSIYVIIAYLLFGAGYYMWWGGWAAQNRNFCLAIPFFLPPLALWLARGSKLKLAIFGILLSISIAANLAIAATDPQLPQGVPQSVLMQAKISHNFQSPVIHQSIPRFLRGDIAMNLGILLLPLEQPAGDESSRGQEPPKRIWLWSLVPLGVIWAIWGTVSWRFNRQRRMLDGDSSAW